MERRSPNTRMGKMPVAKIPAMRSPITKSPMPKSPFPMSPVAYDKYKSRCAYGLFSFFRFRHRHSKKMISDTHNHSSDQYNQIKRDMCIEKQPKKKIAAAKVEKLQFDYKHAQDQSSKKAAKTSRTPRMLPIYGSSDVSTVGPANSTLQIVSERSSNSLDTQGKLGVRPESNCEKDCNSKSTEINLQVNMNEATEAFIIQKSNDGRHISNNVSIHESKHLLGALEVLNSNKDLFVKLLQDPNSLLVEHIQDLRDTQDKEQQKPLKKETQLLENHVTSHPVENIVIMKPCLNRSHHCTDASSPQFQNMGRSVKPQRFHFEQMKRKLMRAIRVRRKKQQLFLGGSAMPLESKKGNVENMVSNSPKKDTFDLRDSSTCSVNGKREEIQMDEAKESDPGGIDGTDLDSEKGLGSSCLLPRRHPKTEKHDLYVDSSIDISVLKNGRKKLLINGSESPQRRLPAYGFLHIASESYSRNQKGKRGSCSSPRKIVEASPYEKKPDVSGNIKLIVSESKSISSSNISFGERVNVVETSISEDLERISSSRMTSKLDSSHENGANQSNEVVNKSEERPTLTSLITDASLETRASNLPQDFSSSHSNHCSGKKLDAAKDNTEQPSQFRSMLNYIGRVMEASNFTWGDLSRKCQSSDQMLDRSLFEDIDVGPTRCFRDGRLLFDYVNEVVLDAYDCYLRGSYRLSFIRPSIVPAFSTDGNMVHELMKCVDRELLLAQNSGSLEKIILSDFEKSRWMDIRIDVEDTVSEVVDFVLDELTTEVVIQ